MRNKLILTSLLVLMLSLVGCQTTQQEVTGQEVTEQEVNEQTVQELVIEDSLKLDYAENFTVEYCQDDMVLLTIMNETKLLVLPQGIEAPLELEEDVTVLQRPISNIYLVATAAMDMFCHLDAVDAIGLSGQKADGWYLLEAKQAMEAGDILYAGKYNSPDYELILSSDCSLAIENTMISHTPEVMEKLEAFGIPVMVEYSSYESHPLGRMEWIKFYGALLGKEELAEQIYEEQVEKLTEIIAEESTDKTVAFFSITSNGMVQIRNAADYVPKMIELAGGNYIFNEIGTDSNRSTVNIQVEEFYHTAKEADYLIYNSTIDNSVTSLADLLEKSELLQDFKAVQEGNVWCTTNYVYQQPMSIGYLIEDMHHMLMSDTEDMTYLFRLE